MTQEIEELWALADECRVWAKATTHVSGSSGPIPVEDEFKRLAIMLDEIAKRLAEKPLHRNGQP